MAMRRDRFPPVQAAAWIALWLYGLGYAGIGFVLAMAHDSQAGLMLVAGMGGIAILAWAGAIAGNGEKVRSFVTAAIGAYVIAGVLGWVVSLVGARGCAALTPVGLIWGTVWLLARAEEEEAFWFMLVLMAVAIVAGATNSAVLVIGILFTFLLSAVPAIGEHLGQQWRTRLTMSGLAAIGGLALGVGWLIRRSFWG